MKRIYLKEHLKTLVETYTLKWGNPILLIFKYAMTQVWTILTDYFGDTFSLSVGKGRKGDLIGSPTFARTTRTADITPSVTRCGPLHFHLRSCGAK